MRNLTRRHRRATSKVMASSLTITNDRTYGTYDDEAVERFAREEGEASVGDRSVHGDDNNALRSGELAVKAGDVNSALIASKLHRALDDTQTSLEEDAQAYGPREDAALQSIDDLDVAEERLAVEEDEIVAERGTRPDPKAHRALARRLSAYGVGDLLFIALVFQVFGISDRPPIPHVPISELELAASATIFALLYLGHAAGSALRDLQHVVADVCSHSSPRRDGASDRWSVAALVALTQILVCLVGAAGLLGGISAVRTTYLKGQGVDAQWLAFLAVQVGIFTAAVVTSYRHAHPHERDWRRAHRTVVEARTQHTRTYAAATELVGRYNATVERRRNQLADGMRHLEANHADTDRQVLLAARRRQLAQPEPVSTPLHPDGLPAAVVPPLASELLDYLSGLATTTQFARYDALDTRVLDTRLQELRQHRTERRERSRVVVGLRIARSASTTGRGTPTTSVLNGTSSANGSTP